MTIDDLTAFFHPQVGRKATPIIEIGPGKVQGFIDPDLHHAVFRGIPYAKYGIPWALFPDHFPPLPASLAALRTLCDVLFSVSVLTNMLMGCVY